MTIDWHTLNQRAATYRTLQRSEDSAIFSGLEVKLSEVQGRISDEEGPNLAIWADTLVLDQPAFCGRANVIVARRVDVSAFEGEAMLLRVPPAERAPAIGQFLIESSVGGAFRLRPSHGGDADAIPVGDDPLQTVLYRLDSDARTSVEVASSAASLRDLIARPWALNSLVSSVTAATWLLDSDGVENRETARSMLRWVMTSISSLVEGGGALPGSYAELYDHAAALLVSLDVAPGAHYVPVLSSSFFEEQAGDLLGALSSYEDHLSTLRIETDVQKAMAAVSGTLEGRARDEVQPLQTQLENIERNLDHQSRSVRALRRQFELAHQDSGSHLILMQAAIEIQKDREIVLKVLDLSLGAVTAFVDVVKIAGGDPFAAKDLTKTAVESAMTAYEVHEKAKSGTPGDAALADEARTLMTTQQSLMNSLYAASVMWSWARERQPAGELPVSVVPGGADSDVAWANFLVRAKASLTSIKEEVGAGSAQSAINDYEASLEILGQYGRAINARIIAYCGQLARAVVVSAQIRAARRAGQRWEQLEQQSKSVEEKLAALMGVVQWRADAIRRAIYVAWTEYRSAYFYLHFQEPPAIRLDMNAAQLKEAFAGASQWVAAAITGSPQVRLPNENVAIEFNFIIREHGNSDGGAGVETALLTPAKGDRRAVLTWNIPIGDEQLAGVLPDSGRVAIWIKQAEFFVGGVTPNSKGRVLAEVSTSGCYQNGFGPGDSFTFVTRELAGNYAYKVGDEKVYDPWNIDTDVYMTPTPFTQWAMTFDPDGGDPSTAKNLQVKLVVAYLTRMRSARTVQQSRTEDSPVPAS